ncbi:MAG: hypothetical protein K1060chlam5_00423 [Candidatus Anoxychlamydiales bacterium]|nr:hypothetical protein [Candidatus Anoxychlamydiales bacterium]
MKLKSERLKKLEIELEDLEKWLNLGLVPKKDIEKHKEEIQSTIQKVKEEKDRLRFMKENGDIEEYVAPKKGQQRQAYQDPQTLPDVDAGMETELGFNDTQTFDLETETGASSASESTSNDEDVEDPFSDKNRWKRGILEDPDADNW